MRGYLIISGIIEEGGKFVMEDVTIGFGTPEAALEILRLAVETVESQLHQKEETEKTEQPKQFGFIRRKRR